MTQQRRNDEPTQALDNRVGRIRLKRISTQRLPVTRMCCRKAIEDHKFRETCIPDAVFTECGHYVTVREIVK